METVYPQFGFAAQATSPHELLQQKLLIHESAVSAAANLINTELGTSCGIGQGLVYSFEEVRGIIEYLQQEQNRSE